MFNGAWLHAHKGDAGAGSMDHAEHAASLGSVWDYNIVTLWSPGLLVVLLVLGYLFGWVANQAFTRFEDGERIPLKQQLYVYTGLVLYYIAEGTPLSLYGHHYSFSAHMVVQCILYLILPPLVLCGLPAWLLRPLFRANLAKGIMNIVTSPLVALFFFNLVFSFYHLPKIMDTLMVSPAWHAAYKALFLFAAFQMWFQVFVPLPEYNRMSELKRMGYIFVNGILLTPACALIIFAEGLIYDHYATVPEQYLFMSVIHDQQMGGVIMKIVQEIVYGIALWVTFYRWYRIERNKEQDDDQLREAYVKASKPVNQTQFD